MATRDYRTIQSTNPLAYAALPQGQRPSWLGSAEMDQYQSGGLLPSGSQGERLLQEASTGWGLDSNVGLAPSLRGSGLPNTTPMANGYQGITSLNPQGFAVEGTAPTTGDRLGRMVNGALQGYDWGNTTANVGTDVLASMVPGGQFVNSGAGAVQGYKSNALDFDRVLPTSGNSGGPDAGFQRDVMPRGVYGGGLLEPQDTSGSGPGYGAAPGGPPAPGFGANPIASRPRVPGQAPVSNPLQSGASGAFTGGSGALVDPYTLPGQDTLESLLANVQRYGDYDAATGRSGMAGAGAQGGGYQYAGYDFAQDAGNRDVGKSAKYAWAEVTRQLASQGVPMPRTKEEAGAYAQQAAPLMAQLGFPISNIVGDKFSVAAREGQDTIDWLGDAGGENPTLTWQSEVLAPGPGIQGSGAQGRGTGSLPASGMDLSSSALFDTLLQQARDIAAGKTNGASILDTNALLQLLERGR